jgi:signal transduction histidine kinase
VSDQRRVEQVLLNLLDNAVKFTAQGDIELAVTFSNDYQITGATAGQRCVRFRVTDTGAGIEDSDLGTLFKPFQQIDSGLTRHHEGSGLGLAICRRLAGLLGGEILVESRIGVGTTFVFTIPQRPSPGQ